MEIPFSPGQSSSLSVTDVSSRVAIGVGGDRVVITSKGTNTAFIALGTSTVTAAVPTGTAAVDCYPILANSQQTITLPLGVTHIAAICNTAETATLYFTKGTGF